MKRRTRCILLDDDEEQLFFLKSKLRGLPDVEVAGSFTDALSFIQWHHSHSAGYDLLISDIEMSGFDGFEVANRVAPKPVLFVTGYPEKGIDYSSVSNAIGAIKKPVRLDALQRLLKLAQTDSSTITLKTERAKLEEVKLADIAYITTAKEESRDKVIHFRNGNRLTAKTIMFPELLELIGKDSFILANNKHVINTDCITGLISTHEIGIAVGQGIVAIEVMPRYKDALVKLKPHLFRSK